MAFFDLEALELNIPSMDFGTYTTMLSAPPKYGKTEFCTKFERPLILDFEKSIEFLITSRDIFICDIRFNKFIF
jgi:hypothetical protein